MALSNAARQKLWRKRHPEKASAHFNAFKEKKGKNTKGTTTECEHDDRYVRVTLAYCGKCRCLILLPPDTFARFHAEWRSRPVSDDEGE